MRRILLAVALSGLLVGQAPAPSGAPVQLDPASVPTRAPVQLIPESLAEFASAYRAQFGRDPDAAHQDRTKYHAYRYRSPGNVTIGMARWVLVDSAGSMNLSGEPGTVTRGGIDKTFARDSHITLPIGVEPIVVDHPCFRQRQDVPNSHIMTPAGDCPTMPPYPQGTPRSVVSPASLVDAMPASRPKLVASPVPPFITISTIHAKFSSGWTERRLVRDARGICWFISSRPPRSDGHATSIATRQPCPRAEVSIEDPVAKVHVFVQSARGVTVRSIGPGVHGMQVCDPKCRVYTPTKYARVTVAPGEVNRLRRSGARCPYSAICRTIASAVSRTSGASMDSISSGRVSPSAP